MDSPQYKHFPMSYMRRLPCPHWKKFPIRLYHHGVRDEYTPEEYCEQCQYDPPKPEVGKSEAKILIYNYLLRHPKSMTSEPK